MTVVLHSRDYHIGLPSKILFAIVTVVEDIEASKNASAGKGLAWNDDEIFALARGAGIAYQDPVGSVMSNVQFGHKI